MNVHGANYAKVGSRAAMGVQGGCLMKWVGRRMGTLRVLITMRTAARAPSHRAQNDNNDCRSSVIFLRGVCVTGTLFSFLDSWISVVGHLFGCCIRLLPSRMVEYECPVTTGWTKQNRPKYRPLDAHHHEPLPLVLTGGDVEGRRINTTRHVPGSIKYVVT